MARTYAMSVLVTRCQQRCDKVADESVSTSEWKALISEVYGTTVYQTVADTGGRYFESEATVAATGAASYNEPTGTLAILGVDLVLDSDGHRRPLSEIVVGDQALLTGRTGPAFFYALQDDQIILFPAPTSGSYKVRYIPQSPDLSSSADADLIDVVTADGEAALIWGVAALALAKAKRDASFHQAQSDKHREALMWWASQRSTPRHRMPLDGRTIHDSDFEDWPRS